MVSLELSRLDDRALMDLRDDFESLARPWRELAVLGACCDEPLVDLARLPLGERDCLLLRVRRHLFGRRVDADRRCHACGERLDISFDVDDLLGATEIKRAEDTVRSDVHRPTAVEFEAAGMTLRLRAPDTGDVAAAVAAPDPELAVLMRCIDPANDAVLQDSRVREAIAVRLAEIDPGAEIALSSTCPQCGAPSETIFDPAGFLIAEITAYTDRLIDQVDQLARVYGWTEADILALGARRRHRYLELTS